MRKYTLPKTVNFDNSLVHFNQILQLMTQSSEPITIDCQEVENIDSSGIALLLELKALSKTDKKELQLKSFSQSIVRLCKVYHISL